jgi:adenylylsulfate reductase subunit B
MGGKGSTLTVAEENGVNHWQIKSQDGTIQTIDVNKKDANKY